VARIGDSLATLLETSDSLRMNRVVGLGHRGLATRHTIDEIIAFFRAAKLKRFSILLCPGPQAETIAGWLRAKGFKPGSGQAVLARDGGKPVPSPGTDLRIARARRSDAAAMVGILQQSFGTPPSRRAWSLAAATAPHYEHYLAFDRTRPVAVASMRIESEIAWLGGAATLTKWRRRGAQSGLIAARLRRAAREDCRWAWVETAVQEPGRPAGSRRNLLRVGFEEVAIKALWVWSRK
jgi:hypothetical protein